MSSRREDSGQSGLSGFACRLRDLLAGPHVGILQSVERVDCEHDDIPIRIFAGQLANTSELGAAEAAPAVSGAALCDAEALAACLGEAAERYAAAFAAPGAIEWLPAQERGVHAIWPDQFALFDKRQYQNAGPRFPFQPWSPHDVIGWVKGQSLDDGRTLWLPAAFVFLPYQPSVREPCFAPGLSTGLACGQTIEAAIMTGLCEVVERDALALAWLGQVVPSQILLSAAHAWPQLARLLELMRSAGFQPALFDLTTDLQLPVAAVMLEGRSPVGNVISFGSACRPHRGAALFKALVEAAHCRVYVKSIMRASPGWRSGRRFERVASFADHARFYSSHPKLRAPLARWLGGSHRVHWNLQDSLPNVPADLSSVSAAIRMRGYEPLVAQLTTPDLRELGLHVVRVLIPGLQPLHGNHAWPHLGGARLKRLSSVFGGKVALGASINPFPHPFA